MKKSIFIFIVLIAGGFFIFKNQFGDKENPQGTALLEEQVGYEKSETGEEIELPSSFKIDVPFVVQAPLADWNWPFNHSCEETSVLMAHLYFTKEALNPEQAQKEILSLNDYEKKNYPLANVSAARQTAILINDYYGYDAKAYFNITLDDIKRELASGNLVLVPAAGQRLKNPYFKAPGPLYHMLVVKGWTPTEFIVNDPGTKRGADFKYSYEIFQNAISDWDLEDWDTAVNVNDRKAMIVINNDTINL